MYKFINLCVVLIISICCNLSLATDWYSVGSTSFGNDEIDVDTISLLNGYVHYTKKITYQRADGPLVKTFEVYVDCSRKLRSERNMDDFRSVYSGTLIGDETNYACSQNALKELEQYRSGFANANSVSELNELIEKYASNDPDKLIPLAKKKLILAEKREAAETKARELQTYRDSFKNARSSIDFNNFINTYYGKDPDKLIPKAEKMKSAALIREFSQERQEAERQRREGEYRREHACDHIYVGKVVNAPITGLVTLFGIKSQKAIVLGVSNRNGVATVRSVDNSGMTGELSCGSLQ